MSILTNTTSRRQRDSYRESMDALRRRYLGDHQSIWKLDAKLVPAFVVPVTHPTIMAGSENDLYGSEFRSIKAPELYGLIRSHVVENVLVCETLPVQGCISCWDTSFPSIADVSPYEIYFTIEMDDLRLFLNHYLSDTLPPFEEKSNWLKEGF